MNRLGRRPHLCLITPGDANPSNFETQKASILNTVRSAVADGVDLVQIREKSLTAKLLYELASEIVRELSDTEALVLINDRPDIAIAAGAHGVHLPENSMSASVVRRAFGEEIVIGVSTHSLESAIDVSRSGADYLFFGPVFETPGKINPTGVGEFQKVCADVGSFPVIALGGVDAENAERVFAAGAAGIAAIRSLNETKSRRAICKVARLQRST